MTEPKTGWKSREGDLLRCPIRTTSESLKLKKSCNENKKKNVFIFVILSHKKYGATKRTRQLVQNIRPFFEPFISEHEWD